MGFLAGGELVNDRVLVSLAGFQLGARELRLVWRVGIMLRLKAKCIASLVNLSAFASNGAVQGIPGVKLHAGLCRPHFHHPACARLEHSGRQSQFVAGLVENPIAVSYTHLTLPTKRI